MTSFKYLLVVLLCVSLVVENEALWWSRRRRRVPTKPPGIPWRNNWDGSFHKFCYPRQSIYWLKSMYSSYHKDRIWAFECKYNPALQHTAHQHCHWSSYANDYDGAMSFQCPGTGFITGMGGVHSNHYQDRRYQFKCCSDYHYTAQNCFYSYYTQYHQYFTFTVNNGYYLRGVVSHHNNGKHDRQFKFQMCKTKYSWGKKKKDQISMIDDKPAAME